MISTAEGREYSGSLKYKVREEGLRLTQAEQLSIYEQLCPGIRLNKAICSPFRKDAHPSFWIYKSRQSDNIRWRDAALGTTGTAVEFMAMMKQQVTPMKSKTKIFEGKAELDFIERGWAQTDYDLWSRWGVSKETLELYRVVPVKDVIVGGRTTWKHTVDNPIYAYKYGESIKIYRPKGAKIAKWKSDIASGDLQGLEQLPDEGDLLIITKSMKDVMCLHDLGYNAVAPSSETSFLSKLAFDVLRKRFKRLLLLFDNDKTGIAQSIRLAQEYKLNFILLPASYGCKDISDFYQKHGRQEALDVLNNLITLINIADDALQEGL